MRTRRVIGALSSLRPRLASPSYSSTSRSTASGTTSRTTTNARAGIHIFRSMAKNTVPTTHYQMDFSPQQTRQSISSGNTTGKTSWASRSASTRHHHRLSLLRRHRHLSRRPLLLGCVRIRATRPSTGSARTPAHDQPVAHAILAPTALTARSLLQMDHPSLAPAIGHSTSVDLAASHTP